MPRALHLVQRPVLPEDESSRLCVRDVYDFDALDLDAFAGIMVSGGCDQRFLAARSERISAWVRAGGRLLVNGHPMERFVEGMPKHRKLDFHSTRDLWLTEVQSHPIWSGVDRRDLLLRTGVPGEHSFEELERIGVAGFYAHAYLVDLPVDAVTITGIGQGCLPVDVAYPLGAGEVVMHLGNELGSFARSGSSAVDLGERTIAYLEGALAAAEVAG